MASNMIAANIVVVTGKLMHLNELLQNDHASIDLKTNVHSNMNGKSIFQAIIVLIMTKSKWKKPFLYIHHI